MNYFESLLIRDASCQNSIAGCALHRETMNIVSCLEIRTFSLTIWKDVPLSDDLLKRHVYFPLKRYVGLPVPVTWMSYRKQRHNWPTANRTYSDEYNLKKELPRLLVSSENGCIKMTRRKGNHLHWRRMWIFISS